MRTRKKYCICKVAIVIISTVLICMLFWGNDNRAEVRRGYGNGPMGYVFPNRLVDSIRDASNIFGLNAQKCASSLGNIRITANYTLNAVLDRIKFSLQGLNIEALEDPPIAHARHSNFRPSVSVPDSETLEIIVIPHSHNDPGWKKTYQQYFDDQTTHILSNIVQKLYQYPDMTFIWVESCFLDKWWSNQTLEIQGKFKHLVRSGRLEITSGMWVAPDEASPHYFALLDQMIEGHYWVRKNLGVIPESSLNFDQFGYSATMPYLVKKAGIKNVLVKRIHRGLKEMFGKQQKLNFHWRQFWDPEGKDDIFGHVDTYEWMSISDSCGPSREVCRGLDFLHMADLPVPGSVAADKPFRSDHVSTDMAQNLYDYSRRLVDQFRQKTANYKYKVMMLPHGGDFRFDTEYEWDKQYTNLKVFMQYVNENKKAFNVHMRFGTLKDFFKEIDRQDRIYGLTYPVLSGDFYTYTENTEYWTGYFTTRQFDKRLSREVLESLRAAELFTSIAFRDANFKNVGREIANKMLSYLQTARKDLGVFQHHDAITGTSKAHVATDYEKLLSSAFTSLHTVLALASEYLIVSENSSIAGRLLPVLRRTSHNSLTETVTIPILSSGTHVVLLNSLTQSRREIVSLTLQTGDVIVLDPKGEEVKFDIIQSTDSNVEIKFEVDFPPVSLLVYTLQIATNNNNNKDSLGKPAKQTVQDKTFGSGYFCENELLNVTFSINGSPTLMCYKSANFCARIDLDWIYYRGTGGAYTMMSQGIEEKAYTSFPDVKFVKGDNFCSIESLSNYFSFKVSLPRTNSVTGRALRVDILSDLSRAPGFAGDLALRIETSINSADVFYVDSNGFQIMGRKFRSNIPFDGNVYPMSAMSILEDDSTRLVVHSAQPHGVVSRTSGKMDFMLDRIAMRPEMDLPEGVQDNKATKTILFIEFQSIGEYEKAGHTETILPSINSVFLNDVIQHPIYKLYSLDTMDIPNNIQSFLNHHLPCDVIIANVKNLADMTSQSDGTSITVFRRAISCSRRDTDKFCQLYDPAELKPASLLGKHLQPGSHVTEMSLSQLIAKGERMEHDVITLEPMDIKTFHLH